MTPASTLTPQEFVAKWRGVTAKERSAYQEHFIDLCHLVGHETPMEADPTGQGFAFEAGAAKQGGGQGWADVFKPGCFAFEYKGQHANLDKAYDQLLLYRESLRNPYLLIVCDLSCIIIHTNFSNSVKRVYELTLDDLLQPDKLAILRAVFWEPESLRAPQTVEDVTAAAATDFARLADNLRKWKVEPQRAAHFLIRLLFILFAEDVGLLPNKLFSRMVDAGRLNPKKFAAQLRQLFAAMATGGVFGPEDIFHFDGGLFDTDAIEDLTSDDLTLLARSAKLDWSNIEPSIFGTLFERGLDPTKRSQLGAHYTGKDDILLVVEPVLMTPLRRRWAEVKAQAVELAAKRDAAKGAKRAKPAKDLTKLLTGFAAEIAAVKVLDAACGSGNFLYLSLRLLLDLEKEVITLAGELGVGRFFPSVTPSQLYGIELNEYACELAQITVWIGYIQWLRENGFGFPAEPILKPLHNIRHMDAIMVLDADGTASEPEWPEATVIVGNPPFLGRQKMISELSEQYVEKLRALYDQRVSGGSDLVCYWFEKARAMLEKGMAQRAGLLATNSIRQSANRVVLDRIRQSGGIFLGWSDRPWVLDGASVRVSIIGFDDGTESQRFLDGQPVTNISADLTGDMDLTQARRLAENSKIAFVGDTKKGSFDISESVALELMAAPTNPNGRPNRDVIRPLANAHDITQGSRRMWIIDFGVDMDEASAALYEKPFEYVREHVKPERDKVRNPTERRKWWLHARPAPDFRAAVASLERFIVTPQVATHRVFAWLRNPTLPAHKLIAFARDDDYFLGVLHSKLHELWSLRLCSWQGVGNDPVYTPTTCFETFPFPWPPGHELQDDPRLQAIAAAARELVQFRDNWLNPTDCAEAELKKRTLTNLYNQRPTWLDNSHKQLDAAVCAAYGWPTDISDDEILARLLALNLERAAAGGQGAPAEGDASDSDDE
jgi:type II restriction/modification system DNA methylase subunit YeeA